MDNLQTARNFFELCDYGKGWEQECMLQLLQKFHWSMRFVFARTTVQSLEK